MQRHDTVEFNYQRHLKFWRFDRNKDCTITIRGMCGDHIFEHVRRSHSFYENELLERIDLLMGNRGDVIVDVGANIGNHAIFFSKVLGAGVICFEPNPLAANLLRTNLELNCVIKQATIVQAAASDRPGVLQLDRAATSNLGTTRVFEGENRGVDEVSACTVDDIVMSKLSIGHQRVSLIKIDVEGFETRVLRGALETIARDRPFIVIEAETLESRVANDEILFRFGYHRLGPFCATPTYIYSQRRFIGWATSLWLLLVRTLKSACRN